MKRSWAIAGIAGVAVAAVTGMAATGMAWGDRSNATVVRVIDGDTVVVVHDEGPGEVVRLLNVDTPEHDECGWAAATEYLRGRVAGPRVELQMDTDTHDRYDRLLAGVFLGNELINASIAGEGLGRPMLIQPNDRFYAPVTAAWTGPAAALQGTGCTRNAESDRRNSDDLDDLTADTDLDLDLRYAAEQAWRKYEYRQAAAMEGLVAALIPPDRHDLRTVSDFIADPRDASAKEFVHQDALEAQVRDAVWSNRAFAAKARMTAAALTTPANAPDANYEDERWVHVPSDTIKRMLTRIDKLTGESAAVVAVAKEQLTAYRQFAIEARAREVRAREEAAAKARAAAAAAAAKAAAARSSSNPSSGSSSSAPSGYYPRFGGPPGYNGPRCFAPGGQYWRPC